MLIESWLFACYAGTVDSQRQHVVLVECRVLIFDKRHNLEQSDPAIIGSGSGQGFPKGGLWLAALSVVTQQRKHLCTAHYSCVFSQAA